MSHIPVLRLDSICKGFFGVPVLKSVSFDVYAGRVLGLIGENGAGKSTLMNIIGGVFSPDSGQLSLAGKPYSPADCRDATRSGIAFVHQELNLFTNLSIAENLHIDSLPRLHLGPIPLPLIDRSRLRRRTVELLRTVQLDRDPGTLISDLPPGERQLVEIAKAVGAGAKVLILDEPTTSLTAPEAQRLFCILASMREQGVAIIYISHNLDDVFRLCDDLLILRDGQVVAAGPRDDFTASGAISHMVGRSIDTLFPVRQGNPANDPILQLSAVCRNDIVSDISFSLRRGEILGISGLMGAGRSELARIIFGLDPLTAGDIRINGARHRPHPRRSIGSGIAMVTENRRDDGLFMDAGIRFNASIVSLPAFASRAMGWIKRSSLDAAVAEVASSTRLLVPSVTSQAARTLSGGNQQKLVLGKWLLAHPSIFILDEPTRGIDIGAKQEVYRIINALADRGAAILMISSEIEELIGLCDRILVMAAGRIVDQIDRPDFDRERILRSALQAK